MPGNTAEIFSGTKKKIIRRVGRAGRRRSTRNRVDGAEPSLGFESLTLRQLFINEGILAVCGEDPFDFCV